MSLLLAFGLPQGPELLVLAGVLLLFFGNRLPSVMRSLGKSVTEFKKGVAGIEEEVDQSVANAEKKQAQATKTTTE
jgi:sec-independent protein translocase protein TatA